jgi:hypothetical protein
MSGRTKIQSLPHLLNTSSGDFSGKEKDRRSFSAQAVFGWDFVS